MLHALYAYAQNSFLWEYVQAFLWTFLFFTLVAAWFFVKRLPSWFRLIPAANWPMVEGRIEAVTVSSFAEQSLSELAYSYLVDGERYSGYFTRQFADEQDAWDYVRPLKGQPIFVRRKPSNPAVSSVRIVDQNPLLAGGQGSFAVRLIAVSLVHHWPLSKGKLEFGSATKK